MASTAPKGECRRVVRILLFGLDAHL